MFNGYLLIVGLVITGVAIGFGLFLTLVPDFLSDRKNWQGLDK